MRHNNITDLTAQLLKERCQDTIIKPQLLSLQGERRSHFTVSTSMDVREDVSARGFWTRGQSVFIDKRIYDPHGLLLPRIITGGYSKAQ